MIVRHVKDSRFLSSLRAVHQDNQGRPVRVLCVGLSRNTAAYNSRHVYP